MTSRWLKISEEDASSRIADVNGSVRANGIPAAFDDLLDALPIVAFMAAADGTIRYVSRGWTAFTGYHAAEAIGTGYRQIIDLADLDLDRVVATWTAAGSSEEP